MKHERFIVLSIDIGIKNLAVRMESREGKVITPHLFDKVCLNETGKMNSTTYMNLINYMELRKEWILKCNLVLIEGQHWQNRGANIVFHVMMTWIYCRNINIHLCILQVNPKLKGKLLRSGNLKTQSVIKCKELLIARKDFQSLEILNSHKKKDDLADTVVQIEALFSLYG